MAHRGVIAREKHAVDTVFARHLRRLSGGEMRQRARGIDPQIAADQPAARLLPGVITSEVGGDNQSLHRQLEEWGVQVTDSKVNRRKDGTTDYDLTVVRRNEITYAEMQAFMEAHEEVLSASNNPIR